MYGVGHAACFSRVLPPSFPLVRFVQGRGDGNAEMEVELLSYISYFDLRSNLALRMSNHGFEVLRKLEVILRGET